MSTQSRVFAFCAATAVVLLTARLPAQCAAASPWDKPGWTVTFHDEFDGSQRDSQKWIDSYAHGVRTHGADELECYAPGGVSVNGGMLHLTGTRQSNGGKPYTSGMVCSYGRFAQTYGWFEIPGTHQQHGSSWTGPDFSQAFHTFAIDWEPGHVTWYMDGVARAESASSVPAEPMYVIANLAVGGGWPGDPDATTPL